MSSVSSLLSVEDSANMFCLCVRRIATAGMTCLFLLMCFATVLLGFNAPAFAWEDGQAASLVIGQASFITSSSGLDAQHMDMTFDVAIDVTHGKLYVVDGPNNRVLRFPYPITENLPTADLVFGQSDFTTAASGTTQNTFDAPRGVAVDSSGRLWVSEYNNHRVVWFNNAYAITVNQPNADGVLGQADFTSSATGISQNGMAGAYGLAVSDTGTLYVADPTNNRVLRFDNAAQKANGADADGVLGQADFIGNSSGLSASQFSSPRGIALYESTLFVADRANARVLRFDNVAAKANGADADGVLGQSDFVSKAANLTQNGMETPSRLMADPYGRLYVSDGFNYDRVLIFNNAKTLANGADAANVLGHADFTTSGSGVSETLLNLDSSGGGMAYDSQNDRMFIADTSNNRVLQFNGTPYDDGSLLLLLVVPGISTAR